MYHNINKKHLLQICFIFFVTRILIFLIGALSYSIFPQRGEAYQKKTVSEVVNIRNVWDKFDSGWYQKLAHEGYPQRPFTNNVEETWGYLPLYALCIYLFSWLFGGNLFITGIVVSNVCTLLGLYVIYKLVEEKFGQGIQAVSQVLICAGSFYLNIVYSEGLFLLLAALVFYLSYKHHYSWAFIIAGLASVTRIQGCILFIIPGIEILLNHWRSTYRYIPALFLSLLPMALFMFYLERTCGDPLAFLNIQNAWGSTSLFPLQGFLGLINGDSLGGSLTNTFFWVMILWIVLSCYRKLPVSYLVYTVVYFLVSTSNELIYGTTRYMLGVLPVFIAVTLSADHVRQFFIMVNILFLALTISAFVTHSMTFI